MRPWLVLGLCAVVILGCGRRDDNTGFSEEATLVAGVDFLMFPNPQANLAAGNYDIVIAPTTGGFSYTLTVTQSDGTSQTFTGSVAANPATATASFEQKHAGGVTIALNSGGANATIALRNGGTTSAISSATGADPGISLSRHQIDETAYANAYYAIVDPTNARNTLADFKTTNGFGSGCLPAVTATYIEVEVRFRDVRDLGYGRHMCARRNLVSGNVAVWVENFQVSAIPGQHYERLNLEAVVNDDRRWHIGTNAIEYGTTPSSGATKLVKFYTYNPDGTRRTAVDLDGRGAKAMPVPCISCHGGMAWPLTASGQFPTIGLFPRADTRAQMQPLNVATLDFWDSPPYRREDQEAALKHINQFVLCTYPLPIGTVVPTGFAEDTCRSVSTLLSQWQGTTAEMVKSWYGGNGMPQAGTITADIFVPTGWTDAGAGVTGAQNLYQTVVAPHCRVCHALRGNANAPGASDIDFTSYAKFVGASGFTARIKHHVFDRGNMPLALLKFKQFWDSTAPATLAAFVPGATSGGSVLQPTRPVAKPGPNRTIVTGVATNLSGENSINATSYRWRVTSANAANTTLTNANTARPTFTANVNGIYTLELIVNDGGTDSSPAALTIGAVASLTDGASIVTVADPAAIRFSHIRAILQENTTTYFCTTCHSNGLDGPPVYYDDYDRNGDSVVNAADLHQFYLDMRARVNFTDTESSRLLQRPSGNHHPGGLISNFDNSVAPGNAGRGAYDIFLNWILNGAPE